MRLYTGDGREGRRRREGFLGRRGKVGSVEMMRDEPVQWSVCRNTLANLYSAADAKHSRLSLQECRLTIPVCNPLRLQTMGRGSGMSGEHSIGEAGDHAESGRVEDTSFHWLTNDRPGKLEMLRSSS